MKRPFWIWLVVLLLVAIKANTGGLQQESTHVDFNQRIQCTTGENHKLGTLLVLDKHKKSEKNTGRMFSIIHKSKGHTSKAVKNTSCQWKNNMYHCEWNHFSYLSLKVSQSRQIQVSSRQVMTHLKGHWKRDPSGKPLTVYCHIRSKKLPQDIYNFEQASVQF